MIDFKFKKEKVVICLRNHKKREVDARTFVINNRKYNLQGGNGYSYCLSDNLTGMILGNSYFSTLKEAKEKIPGVIKIFEDKILNTYFYESALQYIKDCEWEELKDDNI